LDCGESLRRITALGVDAGFTAALFQLKKSARIHAGKGTFRIPEARNSHPQSGDALALSPQSKVSST